MSEVVEHEGVKYRKGGHKAKVGDKIIVVEADDFMGRYKDGEIFTVGQVHCRETDAPIYDSECGLDFYDWEVELLVETEESAMRQSYAPFDCDAGGSAWEEMEAAGREIIEDYKRDSVEHPSHYTQSKFETIEIIEDITGGYEDGFVSYCVGNSLKYLARAPFKHESMKDDIAKAKKYLEFALERIERDEG